MSILHLPLLSLVLYLPLVGALVILLTRGSPAATEESARWIALWTSLVVFVLALGLWAGFDPQAPGFQYETHADWLTGFGVSYHIGLDGISLLFVVLATALVPIAIMASWRSITSRVRDYMLAILLLETTLVGLFSALDFVVFYIFYEATLIPSALLVGVWGGPRRVYAATKFFLFTFGGSLFMLLALLYMWHVAGTTDFSVLLRGGFSPAAQSWMFFAFLLAFGVKLPIWPLHTWLPDAYGEAPAPVTALLSGVLAKAGAYGLLRFAISMLPEAAHRFAPLMIGLGIVAVIYAAIVALAQTDMKKVIAYSSFSHMGIVAIGLFTLNAEGIDGALFQMLAHGIIIAALFLSMGMIGLRAGTREIAHFSGTASTMPKLAALAMLFTMASVGLPGTGGFVGELLVIVGAIHVGFWVALLSGMSMILGAVYMLVLYRRVLFGAPLRGLAAALRDLTGLEIATLVPLAVVTLWMGVYPSSFLRVFDPLVTAMTHPHAVAAAAAPQQVAAR